MTIIRVRDHETLRPLQVVTICLVFVTVAGGSWLLSAAQSTTLVDGALEWQVDSPLRAVVQLLCLNYQFPTIHAGAVKIYILGIGAGLAILISSIGIAASRPIDAVESTAEEDPKASSPPAESPGKTLRRKTHIAPLLAAQILIGMYLLWSFASSRWSAAPALAIGGSILVTIHFFWSFTLGKVLNMSAARIASRIIIAITAVTAVIAIWYYYGRNPTLRAKFPFGNPNFLSACLVPGLLLATTLLYEKISAIIRSQNLRAIPGALGAAGTIGIGLWAFYLAGSRGPTIGLAIGALAILFFTLRRWWKVIPAGMAISAAILGWEIFTSGVHAPSPTGRDATLRLRLYTWSYALQMVEEKPLTGFGQGGFVLSGDSYVVDDVLSDPEVFTARIAHAHNEWLEIMADLGGVGIILIVVALGLTLGAGMHALNTTASASDRWALLGLMGALVGLVVEEAFGVGLRVSGVPTLFYTVIGLIWAMSERKRGLVQRLSATPGYRAGTGVVGVVVGLVVLVLTQQDFAAARSAYAAEQHLQAGEFDEAIRLARSATSRLNPQRALTNLYRLSEAHALVATRLQERAVDRERRAREADLADRKLLALAHQDRNKSDEHCVEGSKTLKKLISWSPGFLNHGRVESWLNLIQADNAEARQDPEARELALGNAAAAIERELLRQPFNPSVALDYANLAGPAVSLQAQVTVLARPLRHHRIAAAYAEVLARLTADATFNNQFVLLMNEALRTLASPTDAEANGETTMEWAPEILRLTAIIRFQRGDYDGAKEVLEVAAKAYDNLGVFAPLGAAACYMELADCRFFSEPDNPQLAIAAASRAKTMAPDSLNGRRLRDSIDQRMIEYLLADGREADAKTVLQKAGPGDVTEEMLLAELGTRYRRLCESMLGRRFASMLRQSPDELLPKLELWLQRAIILNPQDYMAHYRSADLAFHRDDCQATAEHLRRALDLGLAPDVAAEFLQVARQKKSNHPALEALWNDLVHTTSQLPATTSAPSSLPPPQNREEP